MDEAEFELVTRKRFHVTGVALDRLSSESFLRIRQERTCFKCGVAFTFEKPISLAFTDKGNKFFCHECGVWAIDQGAKTLWKPEAQEER